MAYLASDARSNGRPFAAYSLEELTLPDAFGPLARNRFLSDRVKASRFDAS